MQSAVAGFDGAADHQQLLPEVAVLFLRVVFVRAQAVKFGADVLVPLLVVGYGERVELFEQVGDVFAQVVVGG